MPSATAWEFQRVATQLGFVRRRQTGSHERWNHADGRAVTIPIGRDDGRLRARAPSVRRPMTRPVRTPAGRPGPGPGSREAPGPAGWP
ncbi:MAG: type II toxin-antitoxin system HicA family toxin [Candidatus Rokuibacteriota bacterium]